MKLTKKRKFFLFIEIISIILIIIIFSLINNSFKGYQTNSIVGFTFIQTSSKEYYKFDNDNKGEYFIDSSTYYFSYSLNNGKINVNIFDDIKEFTLLDNGFIDEKNFYYKVPIDELFE